MKNMVIIFSLITVFVNCSRSSKAIEKDNLFLSNIPDLCYFNINGLIKDQSIYLTRNNDTTFIYGYDSLKRLTQYSTPRVMARKEHICYFSKTSFPIYKSIRVDYSLWYNGSLVKVNNDTVKTFWYHEFGDIQDTTIYIFKNNRIKEMEIPPLNDHDRQRVKKTFVYNEKKINKIITYPLWGETYDGFGKLDSSVALFQYVGDIVSQIEERFYYHKTEQNHANTYLFDNKGIPVKCILRDTMQFTITKSESRK